MKSRYLVWTRGAVPAFLQSCHSGCRHITHIRGEITDQSAHCREGWEELGCSAELPKCSSTGLYRSPSCSHLLLRGLPPGHPRHFSVTHAICGITNTEVGGEGCSAGIVSIQSPFRPWSVVCLHLLWFGVFRPLWFPNRCKWI